MGSRIFRRMAFQTPPPAPASNPGGWRWFPRGYRVKRWMFPGNSIYPHDRMPRRDGGFCRIRVPEYFQRVRASSCGTIKCPELKQFEVSIMRNRFSLCRSTVMRKAVAGPASYSQGRRSVSIVCNRNSPPQDLPRCLVGVGQPTPNNRRTQFGHRHWTPPPLKRRERPRRTVRPTPCQGDDKTAAG